MNKLKWGIVGPGRIAVDFIADLGLVKECENVVIAVMSDKLAEAERFAKVHEIPYCFDQVTEMLEKARPDIVYIASPHSAHYKESLECIRQRIPVLCEKPLALNMKQAEEMINEAHSCHTFLMEGMWIRFLPSIHIVLELLKQDVIGKVNSIIADMSYRAPKNEKNRFYNPELGGGSLLDLGIYPVYLSLLVLGKPNQIKASARLSPDQIDENCAAIFEFQHGAYSLVESSIIKDTNRQARIYGEKGIIVILKPWNEKPEAVTVSLYNGVTQRYPCKWQGRGFQFEIKEVIRCLSENRIESNLHSHADSLRLMEALDKIREKANIVYPQE